MRRTFCWLFTVCLVPSIATSQSTMEFQSGTHIEVTTGADICADTVRINGTYSGDGTQCSAPLPITLGSFTAQMNPTGPGVLLEWMTITEINNYGFYVERRAESQEQFADVSNLIPGAGTTTDPQYYSWTDTTLTQTGLYYYRLRQQDLDGTIHHSWAVSVDVPVLSVLERAPAEWRVFQNYPNPFNASTSIRFSVAKPEWVTVSVFNILGQEVARPFDDVAQPGYYYRVEFSAGGGSAFGGNASTLASGVYFYRVQSSSRIDIRRMILMK